MRYLAQRRSLENLWWKGFKNLLSLQEKYLIVKLEFFQLGSNKEKKTTSMGEQFIIHNLLSPGCSAFSVGAATGMSFNVSC